ncbi:uncharacterized protein LOC111026735 [Myzus persicae]|uniref:uncharacterized protein LOC111026735 n=1 Tax=Myzus persicae TaxID=13164 RepID=UPI000B936779|nr:uncharacterized protein LOC111026735 [Myzus persicae]
MGVNSDIMNTGYFISPSNMPTNVKIDFVNNHPIQPTGPLIFFDPSKTYYRSIENKDNREVIQRKWLSYNVSNNNMYCSICMAFATNRSVNWVTGIPVNKKIADEVINAKIFSLEIDSTQDVSVMDQLSLCIRYVYKGEVQERFLNMLEVKSSTGEEQYKLVKKSLESLSIDLKNLISESFDGAANMSGQYSGLQAHLKKDSPKSIFTHCHAHVLNLIIGDITNCCIPAQNVFEYCQQTAVWNSKDIALQAIFHSVTEENNKRDRYLCLLELLHTIGFDGIADGGTAAEARNLLEKWTSFEIILTAFTYIHIFSKATPVSKYLQTKCLDYLAAWNQIVSFGNEIKNMSNEFDKIYEQAKNFTEIMEIKTEKFATSYDMVSKSLEGEIKFDDSEESEVTDEDDNLYKNQTMTDIPKYSPKPNEYKNSTCSKCMPCVMKLFYKYNFHTAAFTNLFLAYKFILTLSCTQVHCERSFSKLKIIKTRLRSSISQELLEPLLLISIESDKVSDLEEIISCYAHSSTELKKLLVY